MAIAPKVILGAVAFVFGLIHMSMLAHYMRCTAIGFTKELNMGLTPTPENVNQCLANCNRYSSIPGNSYVKCTDDAFEGIMNDGLAYNDPLMMFSNTQTGVFFFQLAEATVVMFAGLLTLVGLVKEGASAGADVLWWGVWPVAWIAFGLSCWYINSSVCLDASLSQADQDAAILETLYHCTSFSATTIEGRGYPSDPSGPKYALDIELGSDGVGSFIKTQMAFAILNFFIATIMVVLNIVGGGKKVASSAP